MSPDAESHALLATLACPKCETVGSITLGKVTVAKPLGTWSLAGQMLKSNAWETPALVCGTPDCGFFKLPKK